MDLIVREVQKFGDGRKDPIFILKRSLNSEGIRYLIKIYYFLLHSFIVATEQNLDLIKIEISTMIHPSSPVASTPSTMYNFAGMQRRLLQKYGMKNPMASQSLRFP